MLPFSSLSFPPFHVFPFGSFIVFLFISISICLSLQLLRFQLSWHSCHFFLCLSYLSICSPFSRHVGFSFFFLPYNGSQPIGYPPIASIFLFQITVTFQRLNRLSQAQRFLPRPSNASTTPGALGILELCGKCWSHDKNWLKILSSSSSPFSPSSSFSAASVVSPLPPHRTNSLTVYLLSSGWFYSSPSLQKVKNRLIRDGSLVSFHHW